MTFNKQGRGGGISHKRKKAGKKEERQKEEKGREEMKENDSEREKEEIRGIGKGGRERGKE